MPTLTVVAGPNGSGKSTLTRLGRETFQQDPVLDPDAIAKSLLLEHNSNPSLMDAGRVVLARANDQLRNHQSFLVETTLSGNTYLKMMARAKGLGYSIVLIFVGTEDVSINMGRVRARVKKGGHDVPGEDQLRRYPRSMQNLPKAFDLADEAILFDNSGSSHRNVCVKDESRVTLYEPVPAWASFLRK